MLPSILRLSRKARLKPRSRPIGLPPRVSRPAVGLPANLCSWCQFEPASLCREIHLLVSTGVTHVSVNAIDKQI